MGEYVIRRDEFRQPFNLGSATGRWWMFMALGSASVVVGVILLVSPSLAVATLALLVALGLVFTGLGELAGSGRYRSAWTTVAGVSLIAAGVLTIAWPDITLWAVALVAGVGVLLSGAVRLGAAWNDRPDGWGWLAVGGGLSVLVGIVAIAWPAATVMVLALLIGLRMVVFGAAEIAFALALRDIQNAAR
jgi:uncharacterized membrane protein HdeD (DUF308 family)